MKAVSRKNDRKKLSGTGTGVEFSEPTTRGIEEFTRPAEDFPAPSWDKRPMPPEIVAPGEYQWNKPGQKRAKAVKMLAWVTAIILALINMDILTGDMAKTFADILNIETTATTEEDINPVEPSDPAGVSDGTDVTVAPTDGPDATTPAGGSSDAGSETTAPSDPAATSTEATTVPTTSAFEVPECDMTVFACYSEMRGSLKFSNMGNATKVTLEVWDVLTGTLEESRDITADIAADGTYKIKPFTTDEIYLHHQAEYDAIFEFPMQVEFRVIVEYDTENGTDSKTWTHTAVMDRNMWFAKLVHEEDKVYFSAPIDILFSTDSLDGEATILFDQPEKAAPNVFSISMMIDGKLMDISGSKIFHSTYDSGIDGTPVHYYSDVYLLLPDGFDAAAKHDIKLYVYHYLEDYKAVCESVVDIEI